MLFSVGATQEEEILDEQYGRLPVDCSMWPQGALTWFKKNHTLNPHAGKVIVTGLAWMVHHFKPEYDSDGEEVQDPPRGAYQLTPGENESWRQPSTLDEVKQCIACIYNEFDSGDIVSYIDEKCYEHEEEDRTVEEDNEPLYMRLSCWEDIIGVSDDAMQASSWEDMLPHIQDLLDIFCRAYQLQYISM